MSEYEIDFSYVEPRFGNFWITADDPDEAENLALQNIRQTYPEAEDIKIEMVKKVHD